MDLLRPRAPRDWPLAAKVIAALALTLLPLGVLAAFIAYENYRDVVAARTAAAQARFEAVPYLGVSPAQALAIAVPMLMWLAAVIVGWLLARGLVVRPLLRIRAIVEAYLAGDASVRMGGRRYFSREVALLAEAFDAMADDVARQETALRDALEEQKRLTREVHHRVKNNLQIVSSLLSIQARDAPSPDAAHAYALVQARVAALAVVHRWMYDSEAPGGAQHVDLKALATDLSAGLEQGLAVSEDIGISIVTDVERLFVGQDTAVPLAFLITELVTCAAQLTAPGRLDATIGASAACGTATLIIAAPPFQGVDHFASDPSRPASRIITGMARQMRSPLVHDAAAGSYTISFALPAEPSP